MAPNPVVSIGLPVYNGERYVTHAIEAVIQQTYKDYQLIISDNASTDNTQRICEQFAHQYPQITYHRTNINKGAAWNFRRVFELSSGRYFKWMAHDDLIAPEYIEKCVAALEDNPDAVLAYPLTTIIDEDGEPTKQYSFEISTGSNVAHKRFHDLLFGSDQCYEVFGLIRSSYLHKTQVMGNYSHADGVLLNHLSLMGRFHNVPEHLFFSRQHSQQSVRVFDEGHERGRPNYHAYTEWFDTSKKGKIIFPNWRILIENIKAVHKSKIANSDAAHCYFYLLKWGKRHRQFLLKDLQVAAYLLGRHWSHRDRS